MAKNTNVFMLIAVVLRLLLYPFSAYAYYPPDPAHTFHGDADGDEYMTMLDVPAHETQANGGFCLDYNTMQPNNDDDRWNTCDVDGDQYCTVLDLPMLYTVANGLTIDSSPFGNSWAITFYNQQPNYLPNQWNQFQLSVHANAGMGQSGRPGMIVKVTITGGTAPGAELQGRACAPDYWGDPDQFNTGDPTCAVGVSISQWMGATPAEGLTENDPYGLQVKAAGSGTIELYAEIAPIDSFRIPEVSADFTLTFTSPYTISISCPSAVNELVTSHCSISTTDGGIPVKDQGYPDTCNGTITGPSSPFDYAFTPPENIGPSSCNAAVMAQQDISVKDNEHIMVNEINAAPSFSANGGVQPVDITIYTDSVYNSDNGTAADSDLPNTAAGDPGYIKSCSLINNTCSFTPAVTGSGPGTANCHIQFTASGNNCTFVLRATDGYDAIGNSRTINITVKQKISWDKTSPSPTLETGGVDGPVTPRIANNYPSDWKQITLDFSGNLSAACNGTVECAPQRGSYSAVSGSWSYSANHCTFTLSGANLPSENNCRIRDVVSTPACSNCVGKTISFHASKRPSECSPMGGGCGGFIDLNSEYGTGNQVVIKVVKKEDFDALQSLGDGIYTYLLFEQNYSLSAASVERQEFFDGNNDGLIEVTPTRSGPAKITVGYHGYQGSCWKDKPTPPNGTTHRDCFQLTTVMDVDSRNITIPLDYTGSEYVNLPRLYITGDIGITAFQTMVENDPVPPSSVYNGFPNPLRVGIAAPVYQNQPLSEMSLSKLFQPDPAGRTITFCYGDGGNYTIKVKSDLPYNVVIPDLIRQDWTQNCSSGYTTGPGTTYRYYTNEKSVSRIFMVLGGLANSALYNTDKNFNLAIFPIFLKAVGTYTAAIPSSYNHYQTLNLGSTPFETDFRDPGFAEGSYDGGHASGSGRSVPATLPRVLATDQARVNMGVSPKDGRNRSYPTLPYGDPNRWEQGAWSTGGTAVKNGALMTLAGRIPGAGAKYPGGIIIEQLHLTNRVDSSQFTFFKRPHATGIRRPTYTNDNPWSETTTDTGVVSEWMTGIPSTATDPGNQVLWSQVEDIISVGLKRPPVESYIEGEAATLTEVPGNITKSSVINEITPAGSVKATTEWLTFGDVSSPTHDGYYIPNQTGLRPNVLRVDVPINRDGMIWRGTAGYRNGSLSAGSDRIQKKAGGMQYFTISNPALNVDTTRYPDYFVFYLADARGWVDPRADDKDKYGWLNRKKPFNRFWKFYGNLNGKAGSATYEFTIPYIQVGTHTLGTVTSAVPRPWQGYGQPNGRTLEWDLVDVIIGTDAAEGGVTAVFDYQNQIFNWFNISAEFSSAERHQFIWVQ